MVTSRDDATRTANHAQRILQLAQILELVPHLRAHDARHHYQRDYVQGVRVHAVAAKVLVQRKGRCHRRSHNSSPNVPRCTGPRFK